MDGNNYLDAQKSKQETSSQDKFLTEFSLK